MKAGRNTLCFVAAAALGILALDCEESIIAQDIFPVNWVVAGPAPWNDDLNWLDALGEPIVPSAEFEEAAVFGNGGTAVVDEAVPDVIGLTLGNGLVDIQQGGSLKVVGDTSVRGAGTLRLSGNGTFVTKNLAGRGVIDLVGNDVSFSVEESLAGLGTLRLDIASDGNPVVTVGGSAELDGTVIPNFGPGVDHAFGQSWEFLTASNITNVNVQVEGGPPLDPGLGFQVTATGGSASIVVSNLPVLSVDRGSGRVELKNILGGPLTINGYTMASDRGLLNSQGWTSLQSQNVEGWTAAPSSETGISELNLLSSSTLGVGESLDLGTAYDGGSASPREEDVTLLFSTPDGRVIKGSVEYTGPANDLVLRVDPDNGEAVIRNLSSKVEPFDVTGYSILSASGALAVEGWNSFADSSSAGEGWAEANPIAEGLSEVNLTDSHLFDTGSVIPIGSIFRTGGVKDLVFSFSTTAGEVRPGTVEYGVITVDVLGDCNGDGVVNAADLACICASGAGTLDDVLNATGLVAGDLDGGGVAFADFLVLSANFGRAVTAYTDGDVNCDGMVTFPDFLILSANFGRSSGGAAAAVPEPSSLAIISTFVCLMGLIRRYAR